MRTENKSDVTAGKTFILMTDLAEIGVLADAFTVFGKENGISDKVLFNVNLSLEEVITNIISYGYDNKSGHEIMVNVTVNDGKLYIEIADDAKPFNPLDVPEPDITKPADERQVGGLGIFFVRKLMDIVEYKRDLDKNILSLVIGIKKGDK
jgi:anti-sigma regulatory factor (Ser/Thr protein kinase)